MNLIESGSDMRRTEVGELVEINLYGTVGVVYDKFHVNPFGDRCDTIRVASENPEERGRIERRDFSYDGRNLFIGGWGARRESDKLEDDELEEMLKKAIEEDGGYEEDGR